MVRHIATGVLLAVLAFSVAPSASPQSLTQQNSDQYFSGSITKLEADKMTVTRTVLGKEDATRTFLLTPETKFEGKPRVKARVTVRFVSEEDVDRAVHVVVRPSNNKK